MFNFPNMLLKPPLGLRSRDHACRLRENYEFGSNPGHLRMLTYVPSELKQPAPLVVVLHGCTQTATGYDYGAGWSTLADDFGFSLLLPEQQRTNNPNGCFNWFLPEDTQRGAGEALSISQMVDQLIMDGVADPERVFVTGLSAGGAMAAIMMATYPEKFAAGAIIAGLPYGSADTVPNALKAMAHAKSRSSTVWGDLVRNASRHAGPWPRVSIWHGSADRTVAPTNGAALVAQWLSVHDLVGQKHLADRVDGFPHFVWHRDGKPIVEEYNITGMAHGTPLDTKALKFPHGIVGPFLLDVGIASSLYIAKFWGIASQETATRTSQQRANAASSFERHPAEQEVHVRPGSKVEAIINRALKSAGLLK